MSRISTYLFAFPILLVMWIWNAAAAMILWNWFVVPLGLPPLSLWWACGLLSTAFVFRMRPYKKGDPSVAWKAVTWILLRPVVALVIGWLFKLGMMS